MWHCRRNLSILPRCAQCPRCERRIIICMDDVVRRTWVIWFGFEYWLKNRAGGALIFKALVIWRGGRNQCERIEQRDLAITRIGGVQTSHDRCVFYRAASPLSDIVRMKEGGDGRNESSFFVRLSSNFFSLSDSQRSNFNVLVVGRPPQFSPVCHRDSPVRHRASRVSRSYTAEFLLRLVVPKGVQQRNRCVEFDLGRGATCDEEVNGAELVGLLGRHRADLATKPH